MARAFGLKGIVENLDDGRVKIIAEGDDEKLKWFDNAIDIKNTLIQVTGVEKVYTPAGGEFARFGKIVDEGETDSRLDKGIDVMNKMLVAIKDVNKTLVDMNSNLGGKMDNLGEKMDRMDKNLGNKMDILSEKMDRMDKNLGNKMDNLGEKMDRMDKNLGNKMDRMLQKQDELIIEVKDVGQSQNDLLVEVKDINKKVDKFWEKEIVEMKNDISEVKTALRAKGIM